MCFHPPGLGAPPGGLPLHFTPWPAMLPSMEKGGQMVGNMSRPVCRFAGCELQISVVLFYDFILHGRTRYSLVHAWFMVLQTSIFHVFFCHPLAGVSSAISHRRFGPSFPDDVFGGAGRSPHSPRSPRSPPPKVAPPWTRFRCPSDARGSRPRLPTPANLEGLAELVCVVCQASPSSPVRSFRSECQSVSKPVRLSV